ncbi:MAG: DegT/DnrJ/EryC1/StrS family aminotransferase [Treponema sp.]
MIQTYSSTIRRREMDAVLTCMVDEKIGPGELNARLIQAVKEFTGSDGAVALRSPVSAFKYALRALDFEQGGTVMISALAPAWHILAAEEAGCKTLVLDVDETTGLVSAKAAAEGMKNGGRLLLLHESMGIMPGMDALLELDIPIIEDISKSAGALVAPSGDGEGAGQTKARKAGSFGTYAIMALEEKDVLTAGGGAVLIAPNRREWIVLKKIADSLASTELLPDINAALAWIQIKEFNRNETRRKELFALFQRAVMSGRHKTFVRPVYNVDVSEEKTLDYGSTMCCFPLVLNGAFKDVKAYAAKKDIEIRPAYEDSVLALREEELSPSCIKAKSLYLRTALFPLYPRLSNAQAEKIVKVLGTLP